MTSVDLSARVRAYRTEVGTRVSRQLTGPAAMIHHAGRSGAPDTAFMINTTAGVFGGDREEWDINVEPQVQILITDPAPTILFPGAGAGTITWKIDVGRDALALLLPSGLLPLRGSKTQVEVLMEVDDEAHALIAEIVCPGRVAMGETWGCATLSMNLTIMRSGEPLFVDALRVTPGVWAAPRYLLSVAAYGPTLDRSAAEAIRDLSGPGANIGVSVPEERLLLARALCDTRQTAVRTLRSAVDAWLQAGGHALLPWMGLGPS